MALTFRDVKGSPLTSAEADANIRTLQGMIEDIVVPDGVGISSISVSGATFTVHYSNGNSDGPFPLPERPPFVWAFEWSSGTHYAQYEVFTVEDFGVYLVLQSGGYTAPTDFNPDESNTSGPLLALMFGVLPIPKIPVNHQPTGDYTLDPATDAGIYLRMEDTDPVDVHVTSDPLWVEGDVITVRRVEGQVTFVADDTDVSIVPPADCLPILRTAGSTGTLIYTGGGVWDLSGDLALVSVTTTGT